jgi:hypothetical protein
MSDVQRAMTAAAWADDDELQRAYWFAVAEGAADTLSDPVDERALGPLRLLTLSMLRLPDLALQVQLLDHAGEPSAAALHLALDAAWDTGTGALRLAHRALEAHAEAVGYGAAAWLAHARSRARYALVGIAPARVEGVHAVAGAEVRRVAVALGRAAAATAEDPMRVPDELATALGHLLALFMVIVEAMAV